MRKGLSFTIVLVLVIVGVLAAIAWGPTLGDGQKPTAAIAAADRWSKSHPVTIELDDDRALGAYKVALVSNNKSVVLAEVVAKEGLNHKHLVLDYDDSLIAGHDLESLKLVVELTDRGLFANKAVASKRLVVDNKAVSIELLSCTKEMHKAGLGVVVFRIEDSDLANVKIETSTGEVAPVGYYQNQTYIALLGSADSTTYSATIVATDEAGNRAKKRLPIVYNSTIFASNLSEVEHLGWSLKPTKKEFIKSWRVGIREDKELKAHGLSLLYSKMPVLAAGEAEVIYVDDSGFVVDYGLGLRGEYKGEFRALPKLKQRFVQNEAMAWPKAKGAVVATLFLRGYAVNAQELRALKLKALNEVLDEALYKQGAVVKKPHSKLQFNLKPKSD